MNSAVNNKINSRYKFWLFALVILFAVGITAFLNKHWVYTEYDYLFKSDHFNKGDTIYVKADFLNNNEINAISILKEIRPLTPQEIDTVLLMSEADKVALKSKLENAKPYLYDAHISILKDKLLRLKTHKIGSYLRRDVLSFKGLDKNGNEVLSSTNFYALIPNQKALYTELAPYAYPLPKYYTWANNTLYVHPFDVANSDEKINR